MTANQIRETFLHYFQDHGHKVVPSASLIIRNDPTLLFTNAGMNQFKDIFLGINQAEFLRVVDTQKCLRVSGKHNDLEEVGLDTYHHTFFEMLGNWSFGDYFKKESISMAWDLLTGIYGLNPEDIYVTIFEGSKEDQLELDREAHDNWQEWIDVERILLGNKKDNFWEMGNIGPCGPCSEIHIDLRSPNEKIAVPGKSLINMGHPQVVEVWNLVFIQYNRLSSGKLESLPQKHVDTGMGLERLCMAIQKKQSNYDTDLFQPIIQNLAQKAGVKYGENEKTDIALRVIADHIRAISFTIADGQLPSNTGAGYVIRRILRRAVRYGYTYLKLGSPFLFGLVSQLADSFEKVFPSLKTQKTFLEKVIHEEESSFLRTLESGISRFEKYNAIDKIVDGRFAFELFDTFGFPIDLTLLMAKENNWEVEMEIFSAELEAQRLRARKAGSVTFGDWINIDSITEEKQAHMPEIHSLFIGYDHFRCETNIVRFRETEVQDQQVYQWIFEKTPFYPEGGGQIGDTGFIHFLDESIPIIDTRRENNQILHLTHFAPKDFSLIKKQVILEIDLNRRVALARNHSATHLLQASLKQVLGNHIAQKGSLVESDYLRFDFSHFTKLSADEIKKVEELVNKKILACISLEERRDVPFQKAIEMGSTAFFGEKYGDKVRIITFDKDFSRELCGGTHVASTGMIGGFEIENETAVGSGIRRITAITGEKLREKNIIRKNKLLQLEGLVKQNEIISAVESLLEDRKTLLKNLENAKIQESKLWKEELKIEIEKKIQENLINQPGISNYKILIPSLNKKNYSPEIIKIISYELMEEFKDYPLGIISGSAYEGKAHIAVALNEAFRLVGNQKQKIKDAKEVVKAVSSIIQGGGGGQSNYATAGGKNVLGLQEAVNKAFTLLKSDS